MILEMDRVAFRCEGGLVNHFRHGGVGVDGRVDFIDRELLIEGEAHFSDEFGGVVPDDVRAEEFAVFFTIEQFGEAFGFCCGNGFADCDKRDFSDHVFDAGFLECALGFSD